MEVVDWIEHIPFRETRNYVMRVTESIPVYEARLTGQTGALDFEAMLIGARPVIRPAARPEVFPPALPVAEEIDAEVLTPVARPPGLQEPMPGELAVTRSLRPVARTGG